MDDETPNLNLPFIMPSQAQKHVTHNEALRRLDALTQMTAISLSFTEPPETPQNGNLYLIPDNAAGVWSDRATQIAAFQDGAFNYITPKTGWRIYVEEEGLFVFDGTTWSALETSGSNLENVPNLGVNTVADETNRLAVRSDAVLLTSQNGSIRVVTNKETSADTASFLFQNDFQGRAEIGLTGDDNFHFKVSPDGNTFLDGIILDKETGSVSFPNGYDLSGVSSRTLTALHNQNALLSGPLAIRFDASSNRLGWEGRFITISAGHGEHFSLNGFFEITQPPVGTVISGNGGTDDDVTTTDGIFLGSWEALYYVLPIGEQFGSRANNFRRIRYTDDFAFPEGETWLFVALRNGDTNEIRLGNGETIYPENRTLFREASHRSYETFPAFHAYSIAPFEAPDKLIFRQTQLNNGGHYNQTDGLFTAPRSGTYRFDCSLLVRNNNPAETILTIQFKRNGDDLPNRRATFHEMPVNNVYTTVSAFLVMNLEVGDTIECHAGGGTFWSGSDLSNFSGHLITR